MDTLQTILKLVKPNVYMATIDIKDALLKLTRSTRIYKTDPVTLTNILKPKSTT